MDESRARRVADALRELGLDAHLERPGVYAFGVAVQLPDGRRAVWGADTELSATVVRDGVLVGFVPALPAELDEAQLTDAIAMLIKEQSVFGANCRHGRYDVGQKIDFLRANVEIALDRTDLGPAFGEWLRGYVADRWPD